MWYLCGALRQLPARESPTNGRSQEGIPKLVSQQGPEQGSMFVCGWRSVWKRASTSFSACLGLFLRNLVTDNGTVFVAFAFTCKCYNFLRDWPIVRSCVNIVDYRFAVVNHQNSELLTHKATVCCVTVASKQSFTTSLLSGLSSHVRAPYFRRPLTFSFRPLPSHVGFEPSWSLLHLSIFLCCHPSSPQFGPCWLHCLALT